MSAEDMQLYDLFYAITAGCKSCVRFLLHDVGVSAVAPSKTQGHTAVDFAEWAEMNARDDARIERAEITAMVRKRAGRAGLASQEDRGACSSSVIVRGGVLPADGDAPPDGWVACMSLQDER